MTKPEQNMIRSHFTYMNNDNDTLDFKTFIPKFDAIVARGLCHGIGHKDGQMCIESAICTALGLKFSDQPTCVTQGIIDFKIRLNDLWWSTPEVRAKGLRTLGIAQLGSKGVISDLDFGTAIADKCIRIFVPALFRAYTKKQEVWDALIVLEQERSIEMLKNVLQIACLDLAIPNDIIGFLKNFVKCVDNLDQKGCTGFISGFIEEVLLKEDENRDRYLFLIADFTLDVLKDLKSPGCAWI